LTPPNSRSKPGNSLTPTEYNEDQIKAWTTANNLTVPTALRQPDDAELNGWELAGDTAAILYAIGKDDQVDQETKDATQSDDVIEGVEQE